MKINEIDDKLIKFFCLVFGIRKWETVKSRHGERLHWNSEKYTGKKYNERKVKKSVLFQKCKYTGLTRGQIIYGSGSLFPDEIISGEKAELMIDGKLD